MRKRINNRRMSIKTMLAELSERGVTDQQIAERVGLTQPSVTRLRNGKHLSTGFDSGSAIQALHKELVTDQPDVKQKAVA